MQLKTEQRISLAGDIAFLLITGLWFLLYQALLRGMFLWFHQDLTGGISANILLHSFLIGSRFDLIITSLAVLPLVLNLPFASNSRRRKALGIWLTLYAGLITFLAVLELDFYKEFHQRLNSLVFEYVKEDPKTVLSMVWFGFPVIRYFLLIGLFILLFRFVLIKIDCKTQWPLTQTAHSIKQKSIHFFIFLLALACTTVSGRGGTLRQGPPLRWGDAFFSSYTFANHLGLNGSFTLFKAAADIANKKSDEKFWIKQLDQQQALAEVRKDWLTEHDQLIDKDSAALRRITPPPAHTLPIKNVVIILMESFSGEFVGALGNDHGATPDFDLIAKDGLLFDRFFSNGTHTHQGIFATLSCFPNLPGHEYLMQQPEGAHAFSGISNLLPKDLFDQIFIYNGSFTWDNQIGFFKNQGMDHFIGRDDYIKPLFSDPTWGVSDEDMFNRALLEIDRLPKDKPFFAILQSLSNHTPYTLPDPLPMEKVMEDGVFSERLTAMRYSDYALGQFFIKAKQSDYYKDTLFVVLGDHGFGVSSQLTAVDLLRFHVPLLLIGPGIVEQYGHHIDRVAAQVDIVPTVMSLLAQPYQHQCWGRDVLNLPDNDRGIAIIKPSGNDPAVAIISDDKVLVRGPDGKKQLYSYRFQPSSSATPITNAKQEKTLWHHLQAYVQVALTSLKNNTTAP